MNNFRGELVNEATPSRPVEIIGWTGVSEAGDDFLVLDSEAKAKEKNEVNEIKAGIEGWVAFKDFLDFKEKDIIEALSVVESARTIN